MKKQVEKLIDKYNTELDGEMYIEHGEHNDKPVGRICQTFCHAKILENEADVHELVSKAKEWREKVQKIDKDD